MEKVSSKLAEIAKRKPLNFGKTIIVMNVKNIHLIKIQLKY